jgi:ribonuclease P protein component
LELQRTARKTQTDCFLLLWQPQHDPAVPGQLPRVGITVSSKVGNSVVRNRIKRTIREFVRRHKTDLPVARMVVIAKSAASVSSRDVLDRDLGRLFARAVAR